MALDPDPAGIPAPQPPELAPPPPPPPLPPEPEPAGPPVDAQPGQLYTYAHHDDYASPPSVRRQLVLVVRAGGDGQVAVVPLGYADQLAELPASALSPLEALDS
jgi:hypothetical protein